MSTSSPAPQSTWIRLYKECLAPQEITTFSGPYFNPWSSANLRQTASLSSGIPDVGVYLVKPAGSDLTASSFTAWWVSKSGSPAPKLITGRPLAFISLALDVSLSVAEGETLAIRRAIVIIEVDSLSFKN